MRIYSKGSALAAEKGIIIADTKFEFGFVNDDLILIDERRGYAAAVRKGLEVTGTLGILDLAAKRKLIDLGYAIERLKETNFRYRKEIIEDLLAQHRH